MAVSGTLRHPKNLHLASILGIEPWQSLGLLEAFWEFIRDYSPLGEFSKFGNAAVSGGMMVSSIKPDKLMEAFIESAWVDIDSGSKYVHDWHVWCDQTTRKKLERRGVTHFANGHTIRRPADGYPEKPHKTADKTPEKPKETADNKPHKNGKAADVVPTPYTYAHVPPARSGGLRAEPEAGEKEKQEKESPPGLYVGKVFQPGFILPWGAVAPENLGECRLLKFDEPEGEAEFLEIATEQRWFCYGGNFKPVAPKPKKEPEPIA